MWKSKRKKRNTVFRPLMVSVLIMPLVSCLHINSITSNYKGPQVCFLCQSPDVRCLCFPSLTLFLWTPGFYLSCPEGTIWMHFTATADTLFPPTPYYCYGSHTGNLLMTMSDMLLLDILCCSVTVASVKTSKHCNNDEMNTFSV